MKYFACIFEMTIVQYHLLSADMAQSVERRLGKAEVTGSIPVISLVKGTGRYILVPFLYHGKKRQKEVIMAQAYIFLAPGYEEVEMLTVVDMVRRANLQIEMVSITDQREVTSSHNVTITADKLFDEVDFATAQMLILPGGIPGTPNLRAFEPLCQKLQEFASDPEKWVAAVCAAPTVLGELGILDGHKATCYPSFADQIICGEYIKQPVVRDGHIITSRGMGTCIDFAGEIITALKDRDTAAQVKSAIIYQDDYQS